LRPVILFAFVALGCADDLKPVSEIDNLRVLAVQKSEPYARPGEDIELGMLWHDGAPDRGRAIQRTWLSGCFNPPGDQYFSCFTEFGSALGQLGAPGSGFDLEQILNLPAGERICIDDAEPSACIGSGDRFTFRMPPDVIERHAPPPDPTRPRYGLGYVFFAACSGRLAIAPPSDELAFPLWCLDERGEPLGADHFVAGYSAIYAFEGFRNANPAIDGVVFDGSPVTGCIGAACIDDPPARDECSPRSVAEVPICTKSDPEDCPRYSIYPEVPPGSFEIDDVTNGDPDRTFYENMWINYYVDRGSVSSEVRLLADATTGPVAAPSYGSGFHAPGTAGPVNIWAVVRDNRGGVNWARIEVCVR
jgi:hypothetical protein